MGGGAGGIGGCLFNPLLFFFPHTQTPAPHQPHLFFKQKTAYEILRSDWS
eukprot:COSAG01_NODE_65254_length_274_cov_0.262857_1_plen_49_part_01